MMIDLKCGDCSRILTTLDDSLVDAVITDPPYGLGDRMNGGGAWKKHWSSNPEWDKNIAGMVEDLPRIGNCIIWGGNYYKLPPMRGWLIWDKEQKHTSGHAELAWTNLDQPIRTYHLSRVMAYKKMDKLHPTQKPIDLIAWCIEMASNPGDTILDPFMGSGTTGVACVQTGRNFIGIEIEPKYFEIAEKRITEAQLQIRMPI